MAKAELGAKRRCLQCETLFFDLNRAPPVCPKCQAVFVVIEPLRSSPRRAPGGWNTFRRPEPAPAVAAELAPGVSKDTDDGILLTDEEENDGIVPTDEDEQLPEPA